MKTTYSYDGTVAANLVEDKDIVNDLTSGGTNKVLSAEQGKTLKGLIDGIDVPEGIGDDVSELQTKMTAVEQKNTQQDTSISQLQTDMDAVEQKKYSARHKHRRPSSQIKKSVVLRRSKCIGVI